ncbi:MAG: histidine phosphatase family protein, partial [Blautia sp.]|nr:histidine phosphatase family protein [Blautia sp.]
MRLYLIRHGATAGNLQGRYIGRTEEPLCEEGREHLVRQWTFPPPIRALYISPSLRCRQTASLLFPQKIPVEVEDLRECDFGLFEGKNYQELAGNPLYQAWIDSGGSLPFPGGESPEEVRERTLKGFYGVLRREEERREKEKRERELGEGKKEEEKKEKEEGKEEEETKEKGIGIEEEDKKEK